MANFLRHWSLGLICAVLSRSSPSFREPQPIEDVPVAPTDYRSVVESEIEAERAAAIRRVIVYVVAFLSLCLLVWALIEGGERDLWTRTGALDPSALLVARSL